MKNKVCIFTNNINIFIIFSRLELEYHSYQECTLPLSKKTFTRVLGFEPRKINLKFIILPLNYTLFI